MCVREPTRSYRWCIASYLPLFFTERGWYVLYRTAFVNRFETNSSRLIDTDCSTPYPSSVLTTLGNVDRGYRVCASDSPSH